MSTETNTAELFTTANTPTTAAATPTPWNVRVERSDRTTKQQQNFDRELRNLVVDPNDTANMSALSNHNNISDDDSDNDNDDNGVAEENDDDELEARNMVVEFMYANRLYRSGKKTFKKAMKKLSNVLEAVFMQAKFDKNKPLVISLKKLYQELTTRERVADRVRIVLAGPARAGKTSMIRHITTSLHDLSDFDTRVRVYDADTTSDQPDTLVTTSYLVDVGKTSVLVIDSPGDPDNGIFVNYNAALRVACGDTAIGQEDPDIIADNITFDEARCASLFVLCLPADKLVFAAEDAEIAHKEAELEKAKKLQPEDMRQREVC